MDILSDLLPLFYLLVLAIFVGFEVVSKVPTLLHTPLMSGSNAISGIIVVGAIVIVGRADTPYIEWVAYGAIFFATINAVGGFLVTDRMLAMFKKRPDNKNIKGGKS